MRSVRLKGMPPTGSGTGSSQTRKLGRGEEVAGSSSLLSNVILLNWNVANHDISTETEEMPMTFEWPRKWG